MTLARTSTYSFSSDHYGAINDRSSDSPFSIDTQSTFHDGETMIKDAASLLDGVEMIYAPSGTRTKLIATLKQHGITEIRGLPVEERILDHQPNSSDRAKAAAVMKAQEGYGKWS
jgi:hypothetical protein